MALIINFIRSLFGTEEVANTSTNLLVKATNAPIFPESQQSQPMVSFSQSNFWSDDIKSTVYTTLKDLSIGNYDWRILKDNLEAIKSSQSHLLGLIKYYEGDRKHYYESYTARYRDLGGQGTLTGGFGSIRNTKIKTNEDGYKQLMEDLLSHGNEVIKNLGGKSNWEKIPVSIREALVDLAFNKGSDEINKNKTVITNAIDTNDWSSIIPTLKEVKDKNGQEDAGLYRRSLSRAILALRDLEGNELKQAKKEVEKLYSDACEFFDNKNISKKDLEAVWNVYNNEYSKVKVISAESIKHEVVEGETYWGIATKYCPEGVKVKDFVNAIKDYNYVPLDKDLLEKGRKINIPLQFNGKNIKTEGKTEVEIVPVQQEEKPQKTQPQTQIVGNYTISESETENFKIGEEYKGKGYFTVAKDLHSKYIAPGFSITDLSNKIQELNKGVEFEVGKKIKVPKIISTNQATSTEASSNTTDTSIEEDDGGVEVKPLYERFAQLGKPHEREIRGKDSGILLQTFTYKVQSGEGYYRIASRFGVDPKTLMLFNGENIENISRIKLDLNQEIKIPRIVYKVKPGENLNKISKNFGLTFDFLKSINDIPNIDNIKAGQKIALPGYIYKVKQGDGLLKIARNAGISVETIEKFNGVNAKNLKIDDELVILYNDVDYNVPETNKTKEVIKHEETGKVEEYQKISAETRIVGSSRQYLKRRKDKNGKTIATREVFKPTNKDGPLRGHTIIVNAGHGYLPGYDTGESAIDIGAPGKGGLDHEYLINYDNAMRLIKRLQAQGAKVIYLQGKEGKKSEGNDLISQELKKSENKADLFISVHVNSSETKNTDDRVDFLYARGSQDGLDVAHRLEKKFDTTYANSKYSKKEARGTQVLRTAKERGIPQVLWEVGFMNSPTGRARMSNPQKMDKYADLVCSGIVEALTSNSKLKLHTISKGETLSTIAEKYGVTEKAIMKLNNMENNVVKLGEILEIPPED